MPPTSNAVVLLVEPRSLPRGLEASLRERSHPVDVVEARRVQGELIAATPTVLLAVEAHRDLVIGALNTIPKEERPAFLMMVPRGQLSRIRGQVPAGVTAVIPLDMPATSVAQRVESVLIHLPERETSPRASPRPGVASVSMGERSAGNRATVLGLGEHEGPGMKLPSSPPPAPLKSLGDPMPAGRAVAKQRSGSAPQGATQIGRVAPVRVAQAAHVARAPEARHAPAEARHAAKPRKMALAPHAGRARTATKAAAVAPAAPASAPTPEAHTAPRLAEPAPRTVSRAAPRAPATATPIARPATQPKKPRTHVSLELDLSGLPRIRLALMHEEVGPADAIASALREAGHQVLLLSLGSNQKRWRLLRQFCPQAIITDELVLAMAGGAWLTTFRADPFLRHVPLVPVPFTAIYDEDRDATHLGPLVSRIEGLNRAELSLLAQLGPRTELEFTISQVGPGRLLSLLAQHPKPTHLKVTGDTQFLSWHIEAGQVGPAELRDLEQGKRQLRPEAALEWLLAQRDAELQINETPSVPMATSVAVESLLEHAYREALPDNDSLRPWAIGSQLASVAPGGVLTSSLPPPSVAPASVAPPSVAPSSRPPEAHAALTPAGGIAIPGPAGVPTDLDLTIGAAESPRPKHPTSADRDASAPPLPATGAELTESLQPDSVPARGASTLSESVARAEQGAPSNHSTEHELVSSERKGARLTPIIIATAAVAVLSAGLTWGWQRYGNVGDDPAADSSNATRVATQVETSPAPAAHGANTAPPNTAPPNAAPPNTAPHSKSAAAAESNDAASSDEDAEPTEGEAELDAPSEAKLLFAVSVAHLPTCQAVLPEPREHYTQLPVGQARVLWNQARKQLMVGNDTGSHALMCQAALADPSGPASIGLGRYYLERRDLDNAQLWAELAVESGADDLKSKELLGDVLSQRGDVEGAKALWLEAFGIADEPKKLRAVSRALTQQAERARRGGDHVQVELALRRAVVFDEQNVTAATLLQGAFKKNGQPELAERWAERWADR